MIDLMKINNLISLKEVMYRKNQGMVKEGMRGKGFPQTLMWELYTVCFHDVSL